MLARMWDTDERHNLIREKEDFKNGKLKELPVIQSSLGKKDDSKEDLSSQPSESKPDSSCIMNSNNANESLEEASDKEKFLGLKFARSQSGNWTPRDKSQSLASFDQATGDDRDNSDEEFSLKDIESAQAAVGSLLEGEDSNEEDEEEDFDLHFGGHGAMEAGDNDSVQNAINSILDLPQGERMETPDLSNIAGLLDSIEECDNINDQERDPITEAAVNSIPRF